MRHQDFLKLAEEIRDIELKAKFDALESINMARISVGDMPLIPKRRKCLKCSQDFISESSMNRMCNQCAGRIG